MPGRVIHPPSPHILLHAGFLLQDLFMKPYLDKGASINAYPFTNCINVPHERLGDIKCYAHFSAGPANSCLRNIDEIRNILSHVESSVKIP